MGICLDTEQHNGSQVFEDSDRRHVTGRWQGEAGLLATPPDGHFPMQNIGQVKFESPTVPVIFVLGGPGSGKVTHCDNLIHEKPGITHINMTDLLQQYAMGNDMLDFGLLSSKTVTEVLMLEIKMSPNAKTFLVSGYPRNMRDVVEYSEKIQIVNGVVLVSWRQEILERQIDYGAQLGHVILGLARMELHNFYRNVMPVAEYFDQSGLLIAVNGERNPSEVYIDFREAVMRILGIPQNADRPNNVPGSVEAEVQVERGSIAVSPPLKQSLVPDKILATPENKQLNPAKTAVKPRKGLPAFIWVIGGPGSNKAALIDKAMRTTDSHWVHVSVGELLRNLSSSNPIVRDAITAGDMVPGDIVMQLIEQQVLLHRDTDGVVLDGFPRDATQVERFEHKFGQEPPVLLLDCSKLQLGRGRLDDSVSAFRRRLELFRELSLPMLKSLDDQNRLTIVDGDTDTERVKDDFAAALRLQIDNSARAREVRRSVGANEYSSPPTSPKIGKAVPNGRAKHDLRDVEGMLNNASKTNLGVANGVAKTVEKIANQGLVLAKDQTAKAAKNLLDPTLNNVIGLRNGTLANGTLANGTNVVNTISKQVQEQADRGIDRIANGAVKMLNGVSDKIKENGALPARLQNGAATAAFVQNGFGPKLQNGNAVQNGVANGIGHLVNGYLPTNKVAPVRNLFSNANNGNANALINNNVANPVRNMYNEVEGYQNDLHI